MKNYDSRLRKIEEILVPKRNTIVTINYLTSEPESYFELNGDRFSIPPEVNEYEFIKNKLKNYSGIISVCVYIAKNTTKDSVTDFSGLAMGKDDLMISIDSYTGKNSD